MRCLHPPNSRDGVPGLTQSAIAPGASYKFNFQNLPSGTPWMHSHEGLQETFLLAAPLIVHDPADEPTDEQQIILFVGDFSFTPRSEVLERLRHPSPKRKSMNMSMNKADANDVDYDAYLANDRTLADPEVVRVEKDARVRLRIVNGSSGTNLFTDLGDLHGEAISTDGIPVNPLKGSRFPLAIAQSHRCPSAIAARWRVSDSRVVRKRQRAIRIHPGNTGRNLKTLPLHNSFAAGLLDLGMERQLEALHSLAPKPIDCTFELRLAGNMTRILQRRNP